MRLVKHLTYQKQGSLAIAQDDKLFMLTQLKNTFNKLKNPTKVALLIQRNPTLAKSGKICYTIHSSLWTMSLLSFMALPTKDKIIEYITQKKQATPHELAAHLQISKRAIFKQLKNLSESNILDKIGRPPKVFYILKKNVKAAPPLVIDSKIKRLINQNYLIVTPTGEQKNGLPGFIYWCEKNGQQPLKMAHYYAELFKKYETYKQSGLIDGLPKIKKTFSKVNLNHLFYLDFYSIETFGKTKLGQLLLYAKQSQNQKIITELIVSIKPKINDLITLFKIDAVGFIPPTIKREVQFMKELQQNLNLSIPAIKITKIKTPLVIPQKSLGKLEDRIENAKTTIVVEDKRNFKKILLIDDAVGSGATMNETASQIKEKKVASQIIGLAITGSMKGFDIISEV